MFISRSRHFLYCLFVDHCHHNNLKKTNPSQMMTPDNNWGNWSWMLLLTIKRRYHSAPVLCTGKMHSIKQYYVCMMHFIAKKTILKQVICVVQVRVLLQSKPECRMRILVPAPALRHRRRRPARADRRTHLARRSVRAKPAWARPPSCFPPVPRGHIITIISRQYVHF